MSTIKASYSKYRLNREGSGISGGSNIYIGNYQKSSKSTSFRGIVGFDLSENFKDNFNKIVFSSIDLTLHSRKHSNTGIVQIYATIENNLLIDPSGNSSYVGIGSFKCEDSEITISLSGEDNSTKLEKIYQLLAKTQNKILYFLFVADNEEEQYTILRGHESSEGYPTLTIKTTARAGEIVKINDGNAILLKPSLDKTTIQLSNMSQSSGNYRYEIACFINGVRIDENYRNVLSEDSYIYNWEDVRGAAGKQISPNKTEAKGFFNLITYYNNKKIGSFRKDFEIKVDQDPSITINTKNGDPIKYVAYHPKATKAKNTFLKNETYVSIPAGKITVKALYGSTITSSYVELYEWANNKPGQSSLAKAQLSFDENNKNKEVIIKTTISVNEVIVKYTIKNSREITTEVKDEKNPITFIDYTPPSFTYWEKDKVSEDIDKPKLSSFRRVKYDNESKTYVTDYTGTIIRGIAQVKFTEKEKGDTSSAKVYLNESEKALEGTEGVINLVKLKPNPDSGSDYSLGYGRIGFYYINLENYSSTKNNLTDEIKITLEFTDSYGYTITDTITIPSSRYIFHFKPIFDNNKTLVGTSLGIGCALQDEEDHIDDGGKITPILKVNYPLTLESALPITSGGTGATSIVEAWNKIVAPGGVITGSLAIAEGLTIGSSSEPRLLSAYNRIGVFGQGKNDKDQGNAIRFYNVGYVGGTDDDPAFKKGSSNANVAAIMARTWSDDKTKRVHRFWFCQTSPDSDNPNVSTGYSERYMLPEVSFGLKGDVYYDILTTKTCYIESGYKMEYDKFYSNYCGHITGDRKKLVFTIPIKRWLNNINTVTISVLRGAVRKASGGYLIGDGTVVDLLSGATSSVSVNKYTNCITIALTYNNALDTNNNSVVDVQINTINATFTK